MIKKPQFNRDDVEVLGRETLYKRFFRVERISLRHKLFKGGWSQSIGREIFLRGNAVAVVLYDPVHDLIGLVEQFRIGAMGEENGPWCYEVVAGMVEEGEQPEEVARRELVEEANITPYHLEFICNFLSSPGGSDEKLFLFCGLSDLSQAGGVHGLPDENEDIHLHCFAADEVFAELLNGRFNNAAALICLQWLQMNRERLRKAHVKE
ncbi:ADP-ribose pyrophosphatase [Cellvibrio zantedeschiae]|uniref:ADP-ribose pyrophosphatase n=1 Tax=Cellvibrio zantedeschiae TaxID=1237077 RepID=A0ABQ3B1Q3_9GAMM|nr:NUDIX domain-containing protein [Cellvibrio zantedeschiae]GGY74853.1 ADP-ribose pyrophosphatase [Cellvibrio zantedeschiae]